VIPEIIGHRGARSLYPENTIPGFQAALEAGVRHFEIDVGMTRDGLAVISHDAVLSPDLTRTQDGRWIEAGHIAIKRLDFAELQRFDVGRARPGSKTAKRFPRQVPMDGATIPTLEDVLRLDSEARWTIEVKTYFNRPRLTWAPERLVEAVAEIVDRVGAAKRVTVQSFDWRGPRHLRQMRPDLAYAWLTARNTRAWRGGQARLPYTVVEEGGGTWTPQFRELTPALLDRAHAAGLRVVPWTVNAPADIVRLAKWGVDGLITDDPLMARAALHPDALESPPHPTPN
jgi:glycerophosphoryl diester phosphodiesterase